MKPNTQKLSSRPEPLSGCLRLAFALALAGASAVVSAEEWQGLDREAAIRQALEKNPELRVASFELAKARAKLRWSGKLAPPEIEFSANTDQFGLDDDESVLEIGIAQKFPVTDRLAREKELSRVEVALAALEIADARRKLIGKVERGFIAALSARERERQLGEIRDLLASFVEVLQRQMERGTISQLDVNQARLDRQKLEKDLVRQQSETARRFSELKTLLGVRDETSLGLRGELSLPENGASAPEIKAGRDRRPDFQFAVLKEDRARAELALAAAGRWEDIAVRLFAEREASVDEPDGLERNSFVGLGVSIPFPLKRERATAGVVEALGQAAVNSEAVALTVENEIGAAIRVRNELLNLAREAAGDTLALAEENLEAIGNAYRNGQIELFKYQRAQEQILEAKLSGLEARETYHTAEADLREAAAGDPRIQVPTEVK